MIQVQHVLFMSRAQGKESEKLDTLSTQRGARVAHTVANAKCPIWNPVSMVMAPIVFGQVVID